jgi:dTDP-4-dehydrorhamnose reductase
MAKILVTGSTGLLGTTLVPWLKRCGHTVLGHGFRADAEYKADLRHYPSTAALLGQTRPECIINLVALTDVDTCEQLPHEAYVLDVACVEYLCRWIRENAVDCHLIQISSDQLYDGSGPHRESAVTIRNTYALSKIAGELIAAGVFSTVMRTNFFGRSLCPTRRSFTDWLHQSIHGDQPLSLFEDVYFSPLSLATLSDMVERVVRHRPRGVYNVGSANGLSKADFAYEFANVLNLRTTQMRRAKSTFATHLAAYRPKDMRMDSNLFEQTMGLRLPAVIDEIASIRTEYLEPT